VALYPNGESNRRLNHDLKNIVTALSLTAEELAEVERCLFIHTLENDADCLLNLLNPDNYAAVNRLIQDVKPDFVVWDPLNSLTNNDLNSDMDMRAVVLAIATVTRLGNPNRIPLVLHHSLTGRTGAARSVGWDKASYGRNSKVLQAWTRAQINLAPRSGDDPDLLVMSCGKNNNGRMFPEIGLRFDEELGIYVEDESFDPEEFRKEIGLDPSKKKRALEPHEVAGLVEDGISRSKLVEAIEIKFSVAKKTAYRAIDKAESGGLIRKERGRNWNASYFKCDLKPMPYQDND
jgi:RecA-family ATPase